MEITAYEHVGIRVSDRDEALRFYESLGFRLEEELAEHAALILCTAAGVRINLIYNGKRRSASSNILMDEGEKHPGVTHPAFVVSSLDAAMERLGYLGIPITEGPVVLPNRRICFVRDPDGNVVEFDEVLA